MTHEQNEGPSLSTYLETRLNLLTVAIKDSSEAHAYALMAAIDALKLALSAADLRYQQRFDAQADALQAAFAAAKEAVNAALAGADRAVLKAELAADKRFEALNELRQMLNDTLKILLSRTEAMQLIGAVSEKIDALGKRVDVLEGRINITAGEQSGNRRTIDNTRAYLTVGISLVVLGLLIATFVIARMQ